MGHQNYSLPARENPGRAAKGVAVPPLVSSILPTYNHGRFITEALKSLLAQTYRHFEVIVVDDGSTDKTAEIAKQFHDQRLSYLKHPKNLGYSRALNTGLKRAQGKYFHFMSADDQLLPQFFEKEVSLLEKNPQIGVVYSPVIFVDASGKKLGSQKVKTGYVGGKDEYTKLVVGGFFYPVSALTRLGLVKSLGGFDAKLIYSDWDLWLKMARQTQFAFLPECLSIYRKHQSSITHRLLRQPEKIGTDRKVILKKTITVSSLPRPVKIFLPLLFLDAIVAGLNAPRWLKKILAFPAFGVSVATTRLLRRFYLSNR